MDPGWIWTRGISQNLTFHPRNFLSEQFWATNLEEEEATLKTSSSNGTLKLGLLLVSLLLLLLLPFLLNPLDTIRQSWSSDTSQSDTKWRWFEQTFTRVTIERIQPVWPDWVQFCRFAKISKVFGYFLRVYLVFGKMLDLLWLIFYAFVQISLSTMAKYWITKTAIWSHCIQALMVSKRAIKRSVQWGARPLHPYLTSMWPITILLLYSYASISMEPSWLQLQTQT